MEFATKFSATKSKLGNPGNGISFGCMWIRAMVIIFELLLRHVRKYTPIGCELNHRTISRYRRIYWYIKNAYFYCSDYMGNLPNASITVKIIIFRRYILYEKFHDIWLITFKLGEYFGMGENFCVCQLASITICILFTYQFSLVKKWLINDYENH